MRAALIRRRRRGRLLDGNSAPAANVQPDGTIELVYTDPGSGDRTYQVTSSQWNGLPQWEAAEVSDGVAEFTVTQEEDDAIEAGTPLVLIDASIAEDDGMPVFGETATVTDPLVLYNAAHTAPSFSYDWQLDGDSTAEDGTSEVMDEAGDWTCEVTISKTDPAGSDVLSTSNTLTIAPVSLEAYRVEFTANATVPASGSEHANSIYWGADNDAADSTHPFEIDLSGFTEGQKLIVVSGGRNATTAATIGGTGMSSVDLAASSLYDNIQGFEHTLVAGDLVADRPLVLTFSGKENGVCVFVTDGDIQASDASGVANATSLTNTVTITSAANILLNVAFGDGTAMTPYQIDGSAADDDLAWGGYHDGLGRIGAAFTRLDNQSVGSRSVVFSCDPDAGANRDHAGITLLLEPAA